MCLLAVSPDGNWLAASGTSAGVHVYNVRQLKVSMSFGHGKQEEVSPAVIRLREDWEHLENYWPFLFVLNKKFFLFYLFETPKL